MGQERIWFGVGGNVTNFNSAGTNTLGLTNAPIAGTALDYEFAPGPNITMSQSVVAGSLATLTIGASFNQSTQAQSFTLLGNTAGVSTVSGSQLFLAGGNNVTLSGSAGSITISGAAQSSQPRVVNFNASSGNIVLTAGTNITLSQNLSTITVIGPTFTQSTQPAVASLNGSSGQLSIFGSGAASISNTGSSIYVQVPTQSSEPRVVSLNGSTGQLTLSGSNLTISNTGSSIIFSVSAQSTFPYVQSVNASTGNIVFTAGNNVTLSQSASTITINAAGAGAISAVLSLNGSSGSLSLVGGNNITLSQSASTITISGPNTVAQSHQPAVDQLNGSTGTISFVAGTNITLSQSASTITIIGGAAQSHQPAVDAFNNSTGSITLLGSGIASISNTGSSVYVQVPAYTQSTQPAVAQLNGSSGTMTLSASNNITISNTGSTILFSVPSQSVQPIGTASFSASGLSSISGTSPLVVFSGGNNITLQQTTNGASMTLGISGPNTAAQSSEPRVVQLNGSSGTMTISASTNITVSNTGSTIILSVSNQSIQPIGTASFSVSGLSQVTGTSPSVIFSGGNNITLNQTTGAGGVMTVQFSGPNTAAQSAEPRVISINGTSGSLTFNAGSAMSLSQNGSAFTWNNIGVQSLNGSTGTMSLNAGSNMSLSTAANAFTFHNLLSSSATAVDVASVSSAGTLASRYALADHQHRGVGQFQISGNTSNTSNIVYGSLVLAGGNNITLSQVSGAGAATVTVSAAAQTVQPIGTATFSVSNSSSISGTSPSVVFSGGANITLNQSTGANGAMTMAIVGAAGGAAGTQSFSVVGFSQITGTALNVAVSAGANITLNMSTAAGSAATLYITGPTGGAAGSNTFGMSNLGNTAGTSGTIQGSALRFLFAGGNNVTLSQSIDAGSSSATISINVAAPGGGVTLSQWRPDAGPTGLALNTTIGMGLNSLYFQPVVLKQYLYADHMVLPVYVSIGQAGSTSATSGQGIVTISMGLYSRDTASPGRMALMSSRSGFISYTASSGTRLGVTHPLATFSNSSAQSTSQYAVSNASVSSYWNNTVGGGRVWMFPVSSTLSPGEYYVGWAQSISSNYSGLAIRSVVPPMQSAASMNQSIVSGGYMHWGAGSAASNAGMAIPEGFGTYTATSGGWPANITLSNQIYAGTGAMYVPYFEINGWATNLSNL